ncbi:hypothetical protein HYPSUDRAFT_56039 [Hypholoma sublateritium FD-334 SS-4]|uniref:Homeobox domain-containing protein n=1 Tax=Hypholoma sublateritium (strain FD-334 SS-4) TaxID=945553 RepID=A0A0D2NV52_HYPSF|nr:hypothetical protein HYPSUDRAFT_56039 [Hypholoma sublateritium FD-334 SS-4]
MPSEPSQSVPPVGLSAAQEAAKARRKLTEPGRKLIQDYVDSVHGHGRKLTLEERKDLLRKVQSLPGCASYGLQNLTLWLQNHQYINKPYRDKTETTRPSNPSTFPTLTPAMRAQLAALLALEADAGTDPAPAKVALWAGMLAPAGAAYDEVLAYVQLQLDYAGIKRRQTQRLPTPTSPTPAPASPAAFVAPVVAAPMVAAPVAAYTGAHAYYAGPPLSKPALPRRLGAKASSSTPGYPSPTPDTDVDVVSISPEASQVATTASALQSRAPPTLRASILQGVADAVSAPPPALPARMPGTPAEFHALFAAYDAPLAQILCALET